MMAESPLTPRGSTGTSIPLDAARCRELVIQETAGCFWLNLRGFLEGFALCFCFLKHFDRIIAVFFCEVK